MKDYSKLEKEDLLKIITRLESHKKYGLVWDEEKTKEQFEKESENALPVLKEVKSKEIKTDPAKPTNILIEGDNYHALSVLNYTHQGKIDVIYIDPPYNTGNKDFKYNDDYVDKEDAYRHSKWLSFMSKRLRLAKYLLNKNGVIFISIDDNEFAQLKIMCDEIFGEVNLIGIFTWVRKKKGSNLSKEFRKITEYVLSYKNANGQVSLYGQPAYSEKQVPLLNRPNNISILNFQAGKIYFRNGIKDGKLKKGLFGTGELVVELLNDVEIKNKMIKTPFSIKGRFRWSQKTVDEELKNGSIFTVSNTFRINVARYNQADKFKSPSSLLSPDDGIGTNEDATEELRNIFPENEKLPFDYPKPSSLIKYLIASVVRENKNAVICDFMAGSGTTGHAVLDLNRADGGSRQFILCTNNELNGLEKELKEEGISEKEIQEHGICRRVTYPRLCKVINGYKNSKNEKIEGLGGNLKYYKTAFVKKSISRDDLKMRITLECKEMLCLREGIFDEVKAKSDYHIFEQNGKIMAIYYALERDNLEQLGKEMNKMKGEKALYCFTLDPLGLNKNDFVGWQGVSLEPIPQKILDIYEQIYEY